MSAEKTRITKVLGISLVSFFLWAIVYCGFGSLHELPVQEIFNVIFLNFVVNLLFVVSYFIFGFGESSSYKYMCFNFLILMPFSVSSVISLSTYLILKIIILLMPVIIYIFFNLASKNNAIKISDRATGNLVSGLIFAFSFFIYFNSHNSGMEVLISWCGYLLVATFLYFSIVGIKA